jgi:hypothetical protein
MTVLCQKLHMTIEKEVKTIYRLMLVQLLFEEELTENRKSKDRQI